MAGWYRTGTVSVTAGSAAVTGAGTLWVTNGIQVGDAFTLDNVILYEVQAVTADGAITLDRTYAAATATGASYAIIRNLSASSSALLTAVNGLNASVQALLAAGVTTSAQAQAQGGNYATATGSANSYAVTLSPAVATQAAMLGAPIRVKIPVANTGPSTLNLAGLGAVPILHPNGTTLSAGELPAGGLAELVYDGTNFQLISRVPYPGSFLRNRLINGAMMVAQRTAGVTVSPGSLAYTLDGWVVGTAGAPIFVGQTSGAPSGYQNCLVVNGAAGNAASSVAQRVESSNCQDMLAGAYVTVSGMILQTTGSAVSSVLLGLGAPNAKDNWASSVNVSTVQSIGTIPNNIWTAFSQTFLLTAVATNGIALNLNFGAGLATGAAWALTGMQLEVGASATPFERRSIGQEQSLCNRYFRRITTLLSAGYGPAGNTVYNDFILPEQMRVAPTAVISGVSYSNASGLSVNTSYPDHVRTQLVITAAGYGFGSGTIDLSAEL